MNSTSCTSNHQTLIKNSFFLTLFKRNEFFLILAIILLLVVGGFTLDGYLSLFNISRLLQQLSITGLVAFGMTFVIIGGNGGIDLSVGSIFGIATMVAISLQNTVIHGTGPVAYKGLDLPLLLVIFFCLLSGAIFGLINGLGVTKLNIPPFIMTMAMLAIGRGMVLVYSNGFQFKGVRPDFGFLGGGILWNYLPVSLIFFVVIGLITYYVIHCSKYGRELFAVGTNKRAAFLSGLKADRVLILTYIISGLCAALAGALHVSFTTTANPWGGDGLELTTISAVLVGGTSLLGGKGTALGTILGVLFINFLSNFLVLMNIDPYVLQLITACIILVIVLLQSRSAV